MTKKIMTDEEFEEILEAEGIGDDELTKDEKKKLNGVLKELGDELYYSEGIKYKNGGYAHAEYEECDYYHIYITLVWGEDDMGDGYSNKHEQKITLNRRTWKE